MNLVYKQLFIPEDLYLNKVSFLLHVEKFQIIRVKPPIDPQEEGRVFSAKDQIVIVIGVTTDDIEAVVSSTVNGLVSKSLLKPSEDFLSVLLEEDVVCLIAKEKLLEVERGLDFETFERLLKVSDCLEEGDISYL